MDRRIFLKNAALFGAGLSAPSLTPAWARTGEAFDIQGLRPLSGTEFHLKAQYGRSLFDGRKGKTVTINGHLPAPLLRWREGDEVTLHLSNDLDEDTSIHWHGILLPPEMDGVPGVSFSGVKSGETFTYRFPIKQAGTYWYHSHSGFQEQSGLYGPIIIEPKDADPVKYDREYIIVLSDYTFEKPEKLFAKLKKNPEANNFQKRTLFDFFRDASDEGLEAAFNERAMWGEMRMSPTDIADVTGASYTYLVNGHAPGDNWTGLFNPGELVRLRIINASAMTIFNLRIPNLPMTVVQADGLNVQPVATDEFQIGVAETYDVVIKPDDKAYTLMAETIDRSGYARATLAPRAGMTAPVPALRERPLLTMGDMAMAGHASHAPVQSTANDASTHANHGAHEQHKMKEASAEPHRGHENDSVMAMGSTKLSPHPHPDGFSVDMVAENPSNRLDDPGIGLRNFDHRVLTYADLKSLEMNPDMRSPDRELELHLTGNMHRYMWSFDGKKFSEVEGPIVFHEGERLRVTLVNDTMMSHPIHLHGMFFDVVTESDSHFKPRKHTIIVKPGEKLSFDVTADAVGDWAFHCHLLYHMMAGMMQVVSVRPHGAATHEMEREHHQHHDETAS